MIVEKLGAENERGKSRAEPEEKVVEDFRHISVVEPRGNIADAPFGGVPRA